MDWHRSANKVSITSLRYNCKHALIAVFEASRDFFTCFRSKHEGALALKLFVPCRVILFQVVCISDNASLADYVTKHSQIIGQELCKLRASLYGEIAEVSFQ